MFNSASASYISSTLVGSPFFLAVINVSACRHSLMYVSLRTHKSSLHVAAKHYFSVCLMCFKLVDF